MKNLLYLSLFILLGTTLSGQYFMNYSNPGGDDYFDLVKASCVQNDTVYALIQSGGFGGPIQTFLHKISTSDGTSIQSKELINFRGYQDPSLMLITRTFSMWRIQHSIL